MRIDIFYIYLTTILRNLNIVKFFVQAYKKLVCDNIVYIELSLV